MRKQDKLRKQLRNITNENDIYYLDVDYFHRKGDLMDGFHCPVAIPVRYDDGRIGVAIEHPYVSDDTVFTDTEIINGVFAPKLRWN